MNFRPALIPEPVRPLVLFPIYMVRDFVRVLFSITLICDIVIGFIIATAPLNAQFPWILRLLGFAVLVIIFAAAYFFIRKQRISLLDLLSRTEEVASGDIIAAAVLAAELSANSAKAAGDQAKKAFDAVANFDVGNAADTAALATVGAAGIAVDTAANTAGAVVHVTGSVVGGSINAVGSVTNSTATAAAGVAGAAGDAAGETMKLLTNPRDAFGAIQNVAQSTSAAVMDTSVAVAGAASHTTIMVVDVTGEVAGKTIDVVGTVVTESANLAMAGMQQLMKLDPVFIFKKVVRMVLQASMYLVIGLPVVLFVAGDIMWRFGITLNALELEILALVLGLFGIPAFFWVRKRALDMLDDASGEIIRMNTEMV